MVVKNGTRDAYSTADIIDWLKKCFCKNRLKCSKAFIYRLKCFCVYRLKCSKAMIYRLKC